MKLEQEIFNVLVQAGSQGLKLEKIVRHVYNSCNSIFTPLDYKYVYGFVSQYLIKNSKNPTSIIEKGKGYGVYRINYKSSAMQQLMLDFSSASMQKEEDDCENSKQSQELDLFGNWQKSGKLSN